MGSGLFARRVRAEHLDADPRPRHHRRWLRRDVRPAHRQHIATGFRKRRGVATALASCGSYLSGAVWPPIIQHFIASGGWRTTHILVGLVLPRHDGAFIAGTAAAIAGRSRDARHAASQTARWASAAQHIAGAARPAALRCCVAMAMPQVRIVAYCARPRLRRGAQRRNAVA